MDELVAAFRAARSILFITGAGLSADSGLPTYRGVGGLYEGADAEDGVPIEEAVSGAMLRARPEVTWRHILRMERAARGASPNRGHEVIAALERTGRRVWTLTQNVDGLHRRAGSTQLIEIHGEIHGLRCTGCGARWTVVDYAGLEAVPRCERCAAVVRPEVVLFGEALPEAAIDQLSHELEVGFDLVVSVGTTSAFPYIAGPVIDAALAGIDTVEINPGDTEVSDVVRWRVRRRAAEALGAIGEALGV